MVVESPCEALKRSKVMEPPSTSNDWLPGNASDPHVSLVFARASNEPLLDMDDMMKRRSESLEEVGGLVESSGHRKRLKTLDSLAAMEDGQDCASREQIRLLQEALSAANKNIESLKSHNRELHEKMATPTAPAISLNEVKALRQERDSLQARLATAAQAGVRR